MGFTPGICADILSIGLNDKNMREPRFLDFNLSIDPDGCTYNRLKKIYLYQKNLWR